MSRIVMPRTAAWIVFLSVGFTLLAGCIHPSESYDEPPHRSAADAPAADGWTLQTAARINGTCPCFESNAAVDADGWTYVTAATKGAIVRISPAGGDLVIPSPSMPPSVPPGAFQNDAMVVVDAAGRLHFHALLTRYDSNPAQTMLLLGLQYAHSDDRGDTWNVNTLVSLPASHDAPQLGADRQWLTVAPDGALYLSYQRVSPVLGGVPVASLGVDPKGLRIAHSNDEGRTWSMFQSVTGDLNRTWVINGQPIADAERIYIPYFVGLPSPRLAVAVSEDGDHFARRDVFIPENGGPGAWFPSLVALPDGLHILWVGPDGRLWSSFSDDNAQTWSDAAPWGPPGQVAASPWALAIGNTLAVAWFNETGDDSAALMVSRQGHGRAGPTTLHVAEVAGRANKPAYTDFAHAALAPDMALRLVWGDAGGFWLQDLNGGL